MAKRQAKTIVYQGVVSGQWFWRRVASNGRTVADSSEGYTARSKALRAARAVWGPDAVIVVVDE